MKQYIGGFLEFELFPQAGLGFHADAVALHNARACVSHIILQTQMQHVWLPYYTCDALLEPFVKANVRYSFYALTATLDIAEVPEKLADGEYLLYVNYFGLKNLYIKKLMSRYGDELIIDNTQDFFAHGYGKGWSFNSARKSFGVPDGGYLYGPVQQLGTAAGYPLNSSYTADYLIDRLRGAQQEAYNGFVMYEQTLGSQPLQVSELSAAMLSQINYAAVGALRRENFRYYHAQLGPLNKLNVNLSLAELSHDTVPFCYPFMPVDGERIERRVLFENNIFIATLWPDVLTRQPDNFAWERQLTTSLLPLPVDHRYGTAELDKVMAVVLSQLPV